MDKETGDGKKQGNPTSKSRVKGSSAPKNKGVELLKGMTPDEIRVKAEATLSLAWETVRKTQPQSVIKMLEAIPLTSLQIRAVKVKARMGTRKMREKAHCEQCVGWEDVERGIATCRSFSCMQWEIRPYQNWKPKQKVTKPLQGENQ